MPTLRSARALAAVALAAACGGQNSATSTASDDLTASRPEVSGSDHGVSNAVRDMPHTPPFLREQVEHRVMPVPHAARDLVDDPVVQAGVLPLVSTLSGLTFAGVGNGDYGFAPDAAPPDTNGAAGATQYVQWVNESFAVFDKTTGARLAGPTLGNQLFQVLGATHPCAQNNDGDPIAQYDKIANRWVLTQFSVTNGGSVGYYQCVAVSTTSDATGSYNVYAFRQPSFNDYPKLGVWPDGYYTTFNMFTNVFRGARVCAFDRSAMIAGSSATQVCFQTSTSIGSLLPSDLDGAIAPPAGSPNFQLSFGSNSLNLFKFHVDFANPANSTFTGPVNLPVAAFNEACGGGACIQQPNTRQKLDSLGDRLMYRLAYRHFADGHEALVVNHSVNAAGKKHNPVIGVRWYELRSPGNGSFSLFQQGTYAPDATSRWMASVAMDKAGDLALGFSLSSSSVFPSIRITGRTAADPLGTLQSENSILAGGGSQSGSNLDRWGDYSSMSIDPVDDCTFYYTTEYEKTTGAFNWSTEIASFRFPNCQ